MKCVFCLMNVLQIVAQNLENVMAKCYFGKRRLVWEIFENCSKKRIQIPWENIQSMRATIDKNQCGVLKIEVNFLSLFSIKIFKTVWDIIEYFIYLQFDVLFAVKSATIISPGDKATAKKAYYLEGS